MLSEDKTDGQTLKIFKRNVREYIDQDTYKRLLIEAEQQYLEENTFNYWDLAIQNFNNFNGA